MGYTKITVSPSKYVSANKYKYKVQQAEFSTLPDLGDDLSTWTTWDGTSDVAATNGYHIAVAETESDFTCEKVGTTTVVAKTE